jgi:membrane-associated protease RseP (regulator of RpoE activity)
MGIIDTLIGNTTYLILLILLIVYIPLYIYVRSSQKMRDRGIVPYGPFIMFKTARGIRFLDKLAKYKRFWAFFGAVSKIMALFLMIVVMFIMVMNVLILPTAMNSPGLGVEYILAIPGLNPMLPLWYGLIGLVVAVVIHEIAHGIQTRANDMEVESVGVLHCVVPMGAFVEPNEEQIKNASRKARSTMFAAGIAINLTVAIVLFLLMSFGVLGAMSSNAGDRAAVMEITKDSPAFDSGIGPTSIIMGVEVSGSLQPLYYSVENRAFYIDDKYTTVFDFSLNDASSTKHEIHYMTKDGPKAAKMYMGAFIDSFSASSPAKDAGLPEKSFIIQIGPHSINDINDFGNAISSYQPGNTVTVTVLEYKGDHLVEYTRDVTFGNNGGKAFLGVNYSFSGFRSISTPDAELAKGKNPLHNVESIPDMATAALAYLGKPIRGYSPIHYDTTWWYHSSIMSDDMSWVVLQTIFWIFWINLLLAIMNALPAVPFDGGFLFRDGMGAIVDRTHKNSTPEKRERIVNVTTNIMSYAMILILILVIIVVAF